MIIIKFMAVDQYEVGNFARYHHKELAKLLKVQPEELHLLAIEGMIYVNGQDQYNYRGHIEVQSTSQVDHQIILNYLKKNAQNLGLHFAVTFTVLDNVRFLNDPSYPAYLNDANEVIIETHEVEYCCGDEDEDECCCCHEDNEEHECCGRCHDEDEVSLEDAFAGLDLDD